MLNSRMMKGYGWLLLTVLVLSCKQFSHPDLSNLHTDHGIHFTDLATTPGYLTVFRSHLTPFEQAASQQMLCSSVHIGHGVVLTAAHCLMDIRGSLRRFSALKYVAVINQTRQVRVLKRRSLMGGYILKDFGERLRQNTQLWVGGAHQLDIAVLRFNYLTHAPFADQVYLPDSLASVAEHQDYYIYGLGRNQQVYKKTRGYFGGLVQAVSQNYAGGLLATGFDRLDSENEDNGKNILGTCLGDSGGPLVLRTAAKDVVVGIVSGISFNGESFTRHMEKIKPSSCGPVTTLVDVAYHRDFIDAAVKKLMAIESKQQALIQEL